MTKLTAEEITAQLAKWETQSAALDARSAKLRVDIEAGLRRHDAHKLVPGHADSELRATVEQALAELPTAPLDDKALAELRCRHEAQLLVKKLAELKGPLSADTEHGLQQKFEQVLKGKKIDDRRK
jgi:hypothetical protein